MNWTVQMIILFIPFYKAAMLNLKSEVKGNSGNYPMKKMAITIVLNLTRCLTI